MVNAEFPDSVLEPLHAVFTAPRSDSIGAIMAAHRYGESIVGLGLAKEFTTVAKDNVDGKYVVHCIPNDGGGNVRKYYGLLFDKKSLNC